MSASPASVSMRHSHRLLLSLHYLCTGVMVPVMSLMLLTHGCTLTTLPLALGVYGLVTLLLEFPSGVFADRHGRKVTYLFSWGMFVISAAAMLFSRNLAEVVIAMMLYGVSRAFSSGSLDALIIDDFLERGGEERLPVITSQMEVTINLSISAGALVSGFLPMTPGYNLHLLVRLGLGLTLLLLGVFLLHENRAHLMKPAKKEDKPALGRVRLRGNGRLVRLLVCLAAIGMVMSALETYWAPALTDIMDGEANQLLGLLTATSFGLMTVGSLWSGRMKVKNEAYRWRFYYALQLGMALSLLLLALQHGAVGFAIFYSGFYLLLGVSNIHEQTLLNQLATKENRAATLSAASMVAQLGGFGAMALSAVLSTLFGIVGVWLGVAAVAALCVVVMAGWHLLRP